MNKSTTKKPAPKARKLPITTQMTKVALLSEIAVNAGITKAQAAKAYATLLSIACTGARKADGIVLPGLFELRIRMRHSRVGHNPLTGETIRIPAAKIVKANALKALNDAVLSRTSIK